MAVANPDDELWANAGQIFEIALGHALACWGDIVPVKIIRLIWEQHPDDEAALAIIAHELGLKTPSEIVEGLQTKATPSPEESAIKEALEP